VVEQDDPDWTGHKCTPVYCVQGNTLANGNVIEEMGKAFEAAKGPLAERLLAARENKLN
jgi:uncharacterized Ntn-hydrolase superfamily protein